MVIPYDQLLGAHSLTAILTEAAKYGADHGGSKFVLPSCLPLYNRNIANDATTVVRVCAKPTHKSHLNNYTSYKAAKRGIAKFLHDFADKIWHNNLKDAKTFYAKVMALKIMAHLDANSRRLHAINMVFHANGNLILQQAFKSKSDRHRIVAYNTIMTSLADRGLSVDLQILDNKASSAYKEAITFK